MNRIAYENSASYISDALVAGYLVKDANECEHFTIFLINTSPSCQLSVRGSYVFVVSSGQWLGLTEAVPAICPAWLRLRVACSGY